MQAEHLHQWLIAATRDNSSGATNWLKVVATMQAALHDLVKECTCQTVSIIPKVRGDFQGVGLIEVLWKLVASLLNCRLTAAISFHDTLHRFWAGPGTETAALEAKLLQHFMAMR